jgi:hydrogenase maturation factor HypF (carbamoyltransferase family)
VRAALQWWTPGSRTARRCHRSHAGACCAPASIVAIKGLGGFHLACDAATRSAVARLRERKQREEKPFAVMLANAASAQAWVQASAEDIALLESPERPIVLLPERVNRPKSCPASPRACTPWA